MNSTPAPATLMNNGITPPTSSIPTNLALAPDLPHQETLSYNMEPEPAHTNPNANDNLPAPLSSWRWSKLALKPLPPLPLSTTSSTSTLLPSMPDTKSLEQHTNPSKQFPIPTSNRRRRTCILLIILSLAILLLLLSLLPILLLRTQNAKNTTPATLSTPLGAIRGLPLTNPTPGLSNTPPTQIEAFLGIPYAEPPERFAAPVPIKPWTSEYDATFFRPKCVQLWDAKDVGSEDCLYLNVFRAKDLKEKVPVVVWIHGGAFSGGGIKDDYGPAKMVAASNGTIVVVAIQYRLNIFGFAVFPELVQRGWCNLGLQDQRMALEWVKNYIEFFGGDAGQVTVLGHSAGARETVSKRIELVYLYEDSIGYHLLMTNNSQPPPFQRAILQSGSPTSNPPLLKASPQTGIPFTSPFLDSMNCSTSTSPLACLRLLPTQTILNYAKQLVSRTEFTFHPIIDSHTLFTDPTESLRLGLFTRIPIIVGSTTNEGSIFVDGEIDKGYKRYLSENFADEFQLDPPTIQRVEREYYPLSRFGNSTFEAASAVYGMYKYICQTLYLAQRFQSLGAPVWKYRFAYARPRGFTPSGNKQGYNYGSFHGLDVNFVFPPENAPWFDAQARKLSDHLLTFWIQFAKTGDPNVGTAVGRLERWPGYKPDYGLGGVGEGGLQVVLNRGDLKLERDVRGSTREECEFWWGVRGNVLVPGA
ncbi:hypothetical protein HDV05_002811 [Chytridiales sp. JEL 0842]|nr:hypothetical protein HDV05_002811 [Chytridiales sp. JEL 0842]